MHAQTALWLGLLHVVSRCRRGSESKAVKARIRLSIWSPPTDLAPVLQLLMLLTHIIPTHAHNMTVFWDPLLLCCSPVPHPPPPTNNNTCRMYAHAMVELLDPNNVYFGNRIIAAGINGQDDAAWQQTKRLMQGLEGREPVVIIADDSSAVWPHDRRNLFVVERYIYFPSSRRKFGMAGKSLLEIER